MREKPKRWTKRDLELLRELYPDKSLSKAEICKQLGRSWHAIRFQAYNIGLPLRTDVNYWSPEDEKKLIELNENSYLSSAEIGRLINRSAGSVRDKLFQLGITRPTKPKKEKGLELDDFENHIY